MKLIYVFLCAFGTLSVQAEVYKCKVDGVLNFSQQPCGTSSEPTKYGSKREIKLKSLSDDSWVSGVIKDEFDGQNICYSRSRSDTLTLKGRNNYFDVYAFVIAKDFQLRTDETFDHNFRRFAVNIEGKVFQAEKRINSSIISFGSKSKAILMALTKSSSGTFKAKVFHWPYNDYAKTAELKTQGFVDSIFEYTQCEAKQPANS